MAFALNTVTYAWETNPVAQSGSTAYNTPIQRIYIPETGSRTFLSVDVEMYMRDANNGSTISNITAYAMSCSIDGNLAGQPAISKTVTTTGDHTTLFFKDTFTDLFNTRFTGSNHDVAVRWQTPQTNAGPWTGHSFRLICTYQYNDSGVGTNIKTVALPLDSYYGTAGTLLTTQAPFGSTAPGYTNIPTLDTFLPESNKIYRGYWIEYTGIDAANAATDVNLVTQIDSGSEITRFTMQGNMNSDTYYFDIQTGSFTTSAPHTLNARASLSGRLTTISPTLFVTYEYDTTSSRTINSCIIPFNRDFYGLANASNLQLHFHANVMIPEPDPWLAHSAWVNVHPNGPLGSKVYTVNNVNILSLSYVRGSVTGSPNRFNLRFDQNARTSANITLRSGYNRIGMTLGGGSATDFTTYSGFLLLNYTSSALSTPRNHNRTIYFGSGSLFGTTGGGPWLLSPFVTSSISDEITSSYFSNGFLGLNQYNSNTDPTTPFTFRFNYTGSLSISASLMDADFFYGRGPELGCKITPFRFSNFKEYFTEPETIHNYKVGYFNRIPITRNSQNMSTHMWWRADYFTMNQNRINITGSITNCNFPSETYKICVYLSGSNTPDSAIAIIDSSGSGSSKKFYFPWFENHNRIYAVCEGPEYGISNFATASNNDILTIDFSTPSAGGEKSYTWIG